MNNFRICDSTLRDGEQMSGAVFKPEQKIELAGKISDFGVDVIDIMPAVSALEAGTTKKIAELGLKSEITATTMLRKKDIDLAVSCEVDSVTFFAPMSDLHLKYKLGMSREECLEKSLRAIDYARTYGLKINFAGEDSTRADFEYLIYFINQISPYIQYFFICDTVGNLTPETAYTFFSKTNKLVNCMTGLHEHNDFGLATANTIAGLAAGCSLFSGTFCGIGERAGNAAIEEVCAALKFLYGIDLEVKYEEMTDICRMVEKYSGIHIQHHKPIIGKNAFSHESGIHVDGVLKNPLTYEPFDPKYIGQKREIVFGKHSGRSGIKGELGPGLSDAEADVILNKIKSISQEEKRALSRQEIANL